MPDWQTIIVLALVAAAGGYLVRRGWLVLRRRRTGCGACAACPAESQPTADGKPLVTLGDWNANLH